MSRFFLVILAIMVTPPGLLWIFAGIVPALAMACIMLIMLGVLLVYMAMETPLQLGRVGLGSAALGLMGLLVLGWVT